MTKSALKAYIERDIEKIKAEKRKIKPHPNNETLRAYLATRLATLKEIHNLL